MKKPLLLIGAIVLVVAACRSIGVKPSPEFQEQSRDAHGRNPANFPEEQRLNLTKLLAKIKNGKIEDTLIELALAYPEYLKYYTLMYKSGSAQGASFDKPRAIVYGPDAKFIFSFNGHASQPGGDSIEVMTFNDETKLFEFREIVFLKERAKRNRRSEIYDEVDFKTKEIVVSKANPYRCTECHGVVVTGPIWQPHSFWTGAYGSNDDLVYDGPDTDHYNMHGHYEHIKPLKFPRSQGRYINIKDGVKDVEEENYRNFLTNVKDTGRYYALPPRLVAAGRNPETDPFAEPNGYLTNALLKLNAESLMAQLQSHQLREKWANVVLPCYFDRTKLICQPFSIIHKFQPIPLDESIDAYAEGIGLQHLAKSAKAGTLESFMKQAMKDEFAFQVYRIDELEKIFGADSFEMTKTLEQNGARRTYSNLSPSYADYKTLIGPTWDRRHELAFMSEADNILANAALAYLLRGEDINLEDYAINRHPGKGRVLDFSRGGLQKIYEYLFQH